jgi:phenylacetic acid degradation protein paaN
MSAAAEWFAKHRALLDAARAAVKNRGYWSAFAEAPSEKIYGEGAAANGEAAFRALLKAPFNISAHPADDGAVGGERSPYGFDLGVSYPRASSNPLIAAALAAGKSWRQAPVDERAGALLEILHRANARSFELAHAVMHTTGQGFVMAFQAGAAHAQERGLEALAYAYDAITAAPPRADWQKPQGSKRPPLAQIKEYRAMPRGVGLVICCATFPTWNSYPAIFADLLCGNPVIVKPHPRAILPLALTVKIAREALAEAGFDPNIVTLAADSEAHPAAQELALRGEIKLIDFTGGAEFGEWLEASARRGAQVFTEKSGVNCALLADFADIDKMARNLAFSLSLYSGQMCTTPQNIFIPRGGIQTAAGKKSFTDAARLIGGAIEDLLADPARGAEILGAIQSPQTLARLEEAQKYGEVILPSRPLSHPKFPDACMRTPLIVALKEQSGESVYQREHFGPIVFAIAVEDANGGIAAMRRCFAARGALTAAVYADDENIVTAASEMCAEAGVNLAINLTGGALVNHSAAFSDFHATGASPAANAALVDAAFVAPRFYIAQTRRDG